MNNLPQRFDLSARKGAVLGPIEVVVSGIDLTLYSLTGTPDSLAVTSATTFVMTFSATLLDSLPFGQHPGFAPGNSRYWVDATLKTVIDRKPSLYHFLLAELAESGLLKFDPDDAQNVP